MIRIRRLLPLLALCACASPDDESTDSTSIPLAGPTFVQIATGGRGNGSPSSVAVKMRKAQAPNDANVVAACWNDSTTSVSSVTDTKGNTYVVAAPVVRLSRDASCEMFAAFGIATAAAGANTVTVKFSSGALDPDIRIAEYSRIAGVDVAAGSTGRGSSASSGSATTTVPGDLLVGSDYVQSMTTGAGSGFTTRVITNSNGSILEDKIAGVPGPYSATAATQGGWYVMQMAAFKPAATPPDAGAEGRSDGGGSDSGHGGSILDGSRGEGGMETGADGAVDSATADGASEGDAGDAGADATLRDSGSDASSGGGGRDSGSDASSGGGGQTSSIYPLSIAPNKEYLLDVHGNPWFMQGDTAWSLEVQPSQADMLAYLNDRQSRGFNAVVMEAIEHKFTTHSPPWLNAKGDAPFTATIPGTTSLDFTTPNPAYWAYIDTILQEANARGILILFFPDYLGYNCQDEGWCSVMNDNGASRLTTYGQFLGNRYKNQPNILWVNGGDFTPPDLTLLTAVVNGIRSAGDTHLMTAHFGTPEISAADYSPIPSWLQLDDLYTYKDQQLYQKAWSDYARDKGIRPEFLIESDYEGEHPNNLTTSDTWRAQMYEPPLAGSMGYVFGNNPLWPFAEKGDKNASWALTFSPSPFSGWQACLPSAGSQDAARAGAFFRSLPWWTWVPDTNNHTLLSSNDGVCGYTPNGTLAVIYLSTGGDGVINLASFSGPVTAQWFDPSSGRYQAITGSPFANLGNHTFTVPGKNSVGLSDWVLLLEAP
jgi:hypothetical protein